jgi:hypothetical protein
MVRRFAAVFAFALLVAACGGPQQSELPGVYVATYANGTEKVTLDRGGTFSQEVRLEGGDSVVMNTGTWQYISGRVDLQHCLAVGDGFGRIRGDFATALGACSPSVGRRWPFAGELRLGGDEDPSPLWKVR